jgi:hypothetical protein
MAKKRTTPSTPAASPSSQQALDARIDDAIIIDANPDELEAHEIRDAKPDLDFSKVRFIHSSLADHIITLADKMLDNMSTQLASTANHSEFRGVVDMFNETFRIVDLNNKGGKPLNQKDDLKDFIPILTRRLEQGEETRVTDLIKAEYTFEQGSHKNRNTFLISSIDAGRNIDVAKVNWEFAVQSYKEAKEIAEDTYRKSIYDAYVQEYNQIDGNRSLSITALILKHENSFNYATKITQAIDDYGKSLQQINSDLATAFGVLTLAMVTNWNAMAQAQATFLLENKTDSLNLWTSIKSAYDNFFNK